MGTIEERSNKIFDSLLTSVKLPNLLAGKLLAVLALSLTLMAFWSLGSVGISIVVASQLPPELSEQISTILAAAARPSVVIPALISFLLGYLMYGSLFLALGSLCDTIQEAQTLMAPLIVMLMAPLFMLTFALNDAESQLIAAMAWVPVFTPFLLILRMPTEPPLWEVAGQLGLMAVATMIILYLATMVYRAGAVHGAGVNDLWTYLRKLLPGKASASAPSK
jgi:ABC-2 type transport system permease protein